MKRDSIDWVTFDCYGTLIDWEGGIGTFLYDFALRAGDQSAPKGDDLRRRWEEIQFEIIQGPYQRYEAILPQSLKVWADERGYAYQDSDGESLVRSMRSWQPFHDTKPALERARQGGLKLAIISNTDDDIIAHSLKHIDVPFDLVITAEQCGAYKPTPTVFEQSLEKIGGPADRMLHVAFGFKYDIGLAQQYGWQTAWVNRNIDPLTGSVTPDAMWRDLWGLAELSGHPYEQEEFARLP